MKLWLTSDEHYGHSNIIEYCKRPFSDVHEMTLGLIAKHNHLVGKDDIVWHLGDFCWKPKDVAEILKQLNGRHNLMVGNHDSCHPMHKNAEAETRKYLEAGFGVVKVSDVYFPKEGPDASFLGLPYKSGVTLTHMPFTPDERHESNEKYKKWSPEDQGQVLLHGHVHDAWKVRGRQVNVGVDVWDYAPTTMERVFARLAEGDS